MSVMWRAALLSPPFSALTYLQPEHPGRDFFVPGARVLVPLGGSTRMAVLLKPQQAPAEPGVRLKEILWPVDRAPLLGPGYMAMIEQLALRQMTDPGRILGLVLPAGLRRAKVDFLVYDSPKPVRLSPSKLRKLPARERSGLGLLWDQGKMEAREMTPDDQGREYCTVAKDPPWPVRPSARRQIEILEYLWERGSVSRKRLMRELGPASSQVLTRLAGMGLIEIGPKPDDEPEPSPGGEALAKTGRANFELTREQAGALGELVSALDRDEFQTRLLFGVTGSGKTAVYLELAKRCLGLGRDVFLLAPEAALARNLHQAALDFFPGYDNIRLYHGYQSARLREKTFRQVCGPNRPWLIVGTRSSLFVPARDPGLIVMDEEHDSSFKQEERFSYQAKEVAYFLASEAKGLLVLGSATPDVKTFAAAERGGAGMLTMQNRVGGRAMPEVSLVNIKDLKASDHILAKETVKALRQTIKRGEQAIIFLNRRGYSPLMYCLDCGRTAGCPNCAIGLTYHKNRERLVCHYCGRSVPFPVICPGCGGANYLPMGEGTEKLEETLSEILPHEAGILRLDRDSSRRPGRCEEILSSFAAGEAAILIGTQMLSKGHHFPNVTLVAAADGDLGLNLPDYRAAERTFQLLVQAAGRAGRGERPGRVLIQTRDPGHYCWTYVRNNDYQGFYEREMEIRRKRLYPPFVKLALIRFRFPEGWAGGIERLSEAALVLRRAGKEHAVSVLGPAPAPLAMIRGDKRFNCLLKSQDWPSLRSVFARLRRALPAKSKLRASLDLDPVDML